MTEFSAGGQKLYLSRIMYLFDRQIIAYSGVGLSPNLELTNTSLRKALNILEPGKNLLVHSDQGFQYQHITWRNLLNKAGATQSMSRKANCYDNAVMENFFGHLKEELFHHVRFMSTDAFTTALHEYMSWYNTEEISIKLKGLRHLQNHSNIWGPVHGPGAPFVMHAPLAVPVLLCVSVISHLLTDGTEVRRSRH